MNIGENIQRIMGGKSDIKELARKKNIGEIPSSLRIDDYADYISQKWPNFTHEVTYDGTKIRGKTEKWNQLFGSIIDFGNAGVNVHWNRRELHVVGKSTVTSYWNQHTGVQGKAGSVILWIAKGRPPEGSGGVGFTIYSTSGTQLLTRYLTRSYTVQAEIRTMDFDFFLDLGFAPQGDTSTSYDYYQDFSFLNLTDIFGAGNEPTDVNSPEIKELIEYAKNNPEYNKGGLRYAYYKGIKLGQYDYIDTADNILHIGGRETDLGSISFTRFLFGSNYLFYGQNPNQKANTTNYICPIYQTHGTIIDIPNKRITGVGGVGTNVWIRDDSYTDVNTFKQSLNGIPLYYELATPIEIDLS